MRTIATVVALIAGTAALGACELAPKTSYQTGYRGTGMNQINVSTEAAADEVPDPPYAPPGTNGKIAGHPLCAYTITMNTTASKMRCTMST